MLLKRYFLLLVIFCGSVVWLIQAASTTKKSTTQLQSAILDWWPTDPLHMSLAYFITGDKEKQFPQREEALKQAWANFNKEAKFEPFSIQLTTLDIIAGKIEDPLTRKFLYSPEYMLNTSKEEPGGNRDGIAKYKTFITVYPPSIEKPWWLIIKAKPEPIIRLRDFIINSWFTGPQIKLNPGYEPFLPHISIARIQKINDKDLFLRMIENVNKWKNMFEWREKRYVVDIKKEYLTLSLSRVRNALLMLTIPSNLLLAQMLKELETIWLNPSLDKVIASRDLWSVYHGTDNNNLLAALNWLYDHILNVGSRVGVNKRVWG